MHMLYAGIPLKVLQSLMGHKSISSTEVYTKVFALDVAARHRVQFAMPEADAVALMKQLEARAAFAAQSAGIWCIHAGL
jgi:integrase